MEYDINHTRTVRRKRLVNQLFLFVFSLFIHFSALAQNPPFIDKLDDCNGPYDPYACSWVENLYYDIKRDFTVYLRPKNLLFLGDAFVVAGILANTRIDRSIRNTWQQSVRSSDTNHFFDPFQAIGGFSYWYFMAYPGAVALGYYTRHSLAGNVLYFWGYRSFRTIILGGLQQAFFTQALGSGRPNNHVDSKWQPFKYKTGVSGHAFYGAVPFITAGMMADPPLFKYGLYVLSTLPGIARINSDNHYTSQVFLGWMFAFLSARAVKQSDEENECFWQVNVSPYYPENHNKYTQPGVAVSAYYHF